METSKNELPVEQLELITQYQSQVATRIHSYAFGYILLGLLWAAPIAALAAGFGWGGFALLATAMATGLWSVRVTRKTGVRLTSIDRGSKTATYGAWILFIWVLSASAAALSIPLTGTPLIPLVAAGVSAVVTALMGIRIDRELVRATQSGEDA